MARSLLGGIFDSNVTISCGCGAGALNPQAQVNTTWYRAKARTTNHYNISQNSRPEPYTTCISARPQRSVFGRMFEHHHEMIARRRAVLPAGLPGDRRKTDHYQLSSFLLLLFLISIVITTVIITTTKSSEMRVPCGSWDFFFRSPCHLSWCHLSWMSTS